MAQNFFLVFVHTSEKPFKSESDAKKEEFSPAVKVDQPPLPQHFFCSWKRRDERPFLKKKPGLG